MEYIQERYNTIRDSIKDGDIFLFRGTSFLAHLIRFFDDAYFTHAGIAYWQYGRVMIIDSNAKGVRPDFISERIEEYIDFSILRMNTTPDKIREGMIKAFEKADAGIQYDFILLLKIAIYRKTGINIAQFGRNSCDICSEWARRVSVLCGIKCYSQDVKQLQDFITPEDFIRHRDYNEIDIIY